jgi:hypothetical protein
MEDPVGPERPGGRHTAPQQAGIPTMPVVLPGARTPDVPYPLLDGLNPTLGWRFRPPERGGPAFVIIRRAGLGRLAGLRRDHFVGGLDAAKPTTASQRMGRSRGPVSPG